MATTEQPRRICATCDWWDCEMPMPEPECYVEECRRMPPHIDGEWPRTSGKDWCGEWQPRRKDRGGDHD